MKLYSGTLPMRVCCFMSGSGTNVEKIIEGEHGYKVTVIFTDNPKSNASNIAEKHGLPCVVHDIQGKTSRGMRNLYDAESLYLLQRYSFDCIALAGYNYIVTPTILNQYLTINVHPADLSVAHDGKRCYKGLGSKPSEKAIQVGETSLCSSTHIARERVDEGEILVRSPRVLVDPSKSAEWHQQQLKIHGDWVIYSLTLRWIAEGRFIWHSSQLCFDNIPIPQGVDLSCASWLLEEPNSSTKALRRWRKRGMKSYSLAQAKRHLNTLEPPMIS